MSVLSEERLSFKEVTFRLIFGECLKAKKDSGKWLVGGRGRGIRYGSKGKRIILVRFYLLSRGWKHRSYLCVFITFALKTFDVENFNHTQNKRNNNKLIFIHYTTSATINILPCLFHLNRPLLPPNLTVILTHTSVSKILDVFITSGNSPRPLPSWAPPLPTTKELNHCSMFFLLGDQLYSF